MAKRFIGFIVVLLATFLCTASSAHGERVDLRLYLAIDVSASISTNDFNGIVEGFATAITSNIVREAIASGPNQRILVTVFAWSSGGVQILLPNTYITVDDVDQYAAQLRSLDHPTDMSASTAIGDSLATIALYAAETFNDDTAIRNVVVIAGDGVNNAGIQPLPVAQSLAEQLKFTIVAITLPPIFPSADRNSMRYIERYFADSVVAGIGSYVMPGGTVEQIAAALERLFQFGGYLE